MPIVAMPDGQQVNFPDDMPAEQIKGLIASKFPQLAQQAKQTGFSAITQPISNLIDAEKQRGANLANIVNATQQGQQTLPEGLAQGTMNEVGAASEVPSTIVSSIAKMGYDMLPGRAQKAIDTGEQKIAPLIQQYQQNQEAYTKENPRAARNFAAIRETANLLPFANPEIRAMAATGTEAAGNAVKNVGVDAALYVPRGIDTAAQGLIAKGPEARQAIEDSLKNSATNTYNILDEKNIALNAGGAEKIFNNIREDLKSGNIQGLSPSSHPNTASTMDELGKWINSPIGTPTSIPEGGVNTAVGAVKTSGVGQISLKELDGYRRQLAGASYSNPEDVRAATIVRGAIDDAIHPDTSKITANDLTNGTPEDMGLLKQAQNQWATKSRYEDINAILDKAAGDPNKIKSGLTKFLDKDKNIIGWPENELAALKEAASGTSIEKIYKMGGKFGLDLGTSTTLGNTIGPVVAAIASGGIGSGAAAVGAGTVLRQLQKYMARGKAEQLLSTIQKGGMPKEIMSLPPTEAKQIIQQIKQNKN